jgi:hypothetical protein
MQIRGGWVGTAKEGWAQIPGTSGFCSSGSFGFAHPAALKSFPVPKRKIVKDGHEAKVKRHPPPRDLPASRPESDYCKTNHSFPFTSAIIPDVTTGASDTTGGICSTAKTIPTVVIIQTEGIWRCEFSGGDQLNAGSQGLRTSARPER